MAAKMIAFNEDARRGLERGMNGGDALLLVGRPITARHAHAAEAIGGDERAVTAKLDFLHRCLTRNGKRRPRDRRL